MVESDELVARGRTEIRLKVKTFLRRMYKTPGDGWKAAALPRMAALRVAACEVWRILSLAGVRVLYILNA
jgi:hypothetical protein